MYLVTGAAGFLGSTVCRKLVDRNEKVRAFVLEGDKSAAYLPEEVEIVYGDLCKGIWLTDSLEQRIREKAESATFLGMSLSALRILQSLFQRRADVNR